jgi:NAD(P) transhydrogenase subunit alpha
MRLAVIRERQDQETRVAATPETVRKLIGLGLEVAVEAGAGLASGIADDDYAQAGAQIAADAGTAAAGAKIVFAVQMPSELGGIAPGTLLVCISGMGSDAERARAVAAAGIDVVAMEMLPRITRAQSMDVLSSQANLAGYRAVIEAAGAFDRGFPMMMTAAGTVPPARVFVIGAGVAGLQAIATARRMGAIVSATDGGERRDQVAGGQFCRRGGRGECRGADFGRVCARDERSVSRKTGRTGGGDHCQDRYCHHHGAGDGAAGAGAGE